MPPYCGTPSAYGSQRGPSWPPLSDGKRLRWDGLNVQQVEGTRGTGGRSGMESPRGDQGAPSGEVKRASVRESTTWNLPM